MGLYIGLNYDFLTATPVLQWWFGTRRISKHTVLICFFSYFEEGLLREFFYAYHIKEKNDSIFQDHAVRYVYDNVGNLREEHTYDASMKPLERNGIAVHILASMAPITRSHTKRLMPKVIVPFESGIAHIRWHITRWEERSNFDADGDLNGGRQHEAINKYVFDECGQLIGRSFYDSLEQPINFDGAAVIKYNYDA